MNTLNELLGINIITEDLLKNLSKDIELSKDLYNRLTTMIED